MVPGNLRCVRVTRGLCNIDGGKDKEPLSITENVNERDTVLPIDNGTESGGFGSG
jgi:hypothetical protein